MFAGDAADRLGGTYDRAVTNLVALRVVDRLEAVDVHIEHGVLMPIAAATRLFVMHELVPAAPVVESRQIVDERFVFSPLDAAFQLLGVELPAENRAQRACRRDQMRCQAR